MANWSRCGTEVRLSYISIDFTFLLLPILSIGKCNKANSIDLVLSLLKRRLFAVRELGAISTKSNSSINFIHENIQVSVNFKKFGIVGKGLQSDIIW